MKLRRLLSLLMAPLAVSLAFAAAAPITASAATASCTSYSTFYPGGNPNYGFFYVPSIGVGTRNTNCLLGVGNQSDAVLVLQLDLDACYSNDGVNIAADGIFGPKTQAAVRVAQRVGGVTQDGIYGPVTRSHMFWGGLGTGYHCYFDGGIPV